MGIIGVARWKNSGREGGDILIENIARSHMGKRVGKWNMSLQSYRSGTFPSRSIFSASTAENAYALLEDQSIDLTGSERAHPRVTFVTITPPESLPILLAQIAGNWTSSRQNAAQNGRGVVPGGAGQVVLDGSIYSVGNDWLVRIANVNQAGGVFRGLIIEAEYLPVQDLPSLRGVQGNSAIVTEFLMSIVPQSTGEERIMAVTLTPQQWEDVVAGPQEDDLGTSFDETKTNVREEDDIYFTPEDHEPKQSVGQSRERRSAYLILRCLQEEGML